MRNSTFVSRMRLTAMSALVLVSVVACTTVVEETGRKQFNVLSPSQEASMGLSEFERYKQSKPISRNPRYNSMTSRVGSRLSQVISMPNAQWEFIVFQDDSPNAFALPGGKVGVHTGLFKVVKNEAQLAAVLGHEIGHVKARHSGERLSTAAAGAAVGAIAGEVISRKTGMDRRAAQGVTQGAVTLSVLRFSRNQELEADRLGAIYMARGGYDPRESVNLWKQFAQYKASSGAGRPPAFLSTHPLDQTRIDRLDAFMPEAMAIYQG